MFVGVLAGRIMMLANAIAKLQSILIEVRRSRAPSLAMLCQLQRTLSLTREGASVAGGDSDG